MTPIDEEKYYLHCRYLIEKKLEWGKSEKWSHTHYVKLSKLIDEETGMLLSHNTLKRFWGKISYKGGQSSTTKNTLALFLQYNNWNDFLEKEFSVFPEETPQENFVPPHKIRKWLWISLPVFLIILSGLFFFSQYNEKDIYIPDNIRFEVLNPVDYAPHHFKVKYDFSNFPPSDIIIKPDFLQPNSVSNDSGSISYAYLMPGFGKVHLIVDADTIKSIPVHTITDDWMVVYADNIEHIHYSKPDQHAGYYTVLPQNLPPMGIDTAHVFYLNYLNIRDFNIDGGNFIAGASLRNKWNRPMLHTNTMHFGIWGTDGIISIHLARKGYPYIINHQISDVKLSGDNIDMSAFTVDMEEWHHLDIEVKNDTAVIQLNGKVVLSQPFHKNIGAIKGIRIRSKGVGEFKKVYLNPH